MAGSAGRRGPDPEGLLMFTLENQGSYNLKKLKSKLSNYKLNDETSIPWGSLEHADCVTTKDLLVDKYGLEGALDVVFEVLNIIGLHGAAEDLRERRAQNALSAPPPRTQVPQPPPPSRPAPATPPARPQGPAPTIPPAHPQGPAPTIPPAHPQGPAPTIAPAHPQGPAPRTDLRGILRCSPEEYRRICAKGSKIYPITPFEGRTRHALIICNMNFRHLPERHGAHSDIDGMADLLEGLGYAVRVERNQTAQGMREAIKEFSDKNHQNSDSTFLVFMSHGDRDVLCGTDSTEDGSNVLRFDEIFETFNNQNCRTLRNKPKVVLIQACRGEEKSRVSMEDGARAPNGADQGNIADDARSSSDADQENPEMDAMVALKESDFICFYATTPGTVSFRHTKNGAFFIQKVIARIKQDAHDKPIDKIFLNVQAEFTNGLQMPTLERTTLSKKFYLLPGY